MCRIRTRKCPLESRIKPPKRGSFHNQAGRSVFGGNQGGGIKGLIPTSVTPSGISPLYGVFVFGVRPFLLYHRFVDSISHTLGGNHLLEGTIFCGAKLRQVGSECLGLHSSWFGLEGQTGLAPLRFPNRGQKAFPTIRAMGFADVSGTFLSFFGQVLAVLQVLILLAVSSILLFLCAGMRRLFGFLPREAIPRFLSSRFRASFVRFVLGSTASFSGPGFRGSRFG